MPADWLIPLAVGALSTGGSLAGGARDAATNVRIAREQMAFQERMSSTSAQRAVADYRAAGLNPALAYDKGASSPGGAGFTVGGSDQALERGISSAQRTKEMIQALKIAREQNEADLAVKHNDAHLKNAMREEVNQRATLASEQVKTEVQNRNFAAAAQPFALQSAQTNALLQQLLIPGARNTARFEEFLGGPNLNIGGKSGTTMLGGARALSEILKILRGSK